MESCQVKLEVLDIHFGRGMSLPYFNNVCCVQETEQTLPTGLKRTCLQADFDFSPSEGNEARLDLSVDNRLVQVLLRRLQGTVSPPPLPSLPSSLA